MINSVDSSRHKQSDSRQVTSDRNVTCLQLVSDLGIAASDRRKDEELLAHGEPSRLRASEADAGRKALRGSLVFTRPGTVMTVFKVVIGAFGRCLALYKDELIDSSNVAC